MNLSNVHLSEIPGLNEARPLISGAKVSLNPEPWTLSRRALSGAKLNLKPETLNTKPHLLFLSILI